MKRVTTLDFETDPFEFGAVPQPFLSGYYTGKKTVSFWGDNCIIQLVKSLERETEDLCIFAHNGGKFDIFYLMPYLTPGSLKIINGRIIQAKIGRHEIRDSFAIMPFGLAKYAKKEIDYGKFTREKREQFRDEITEYWRMDCVYLWELCDAFLREFSDKLTIGGASLRQLKTFHSFQCGNENFDALFRADFYFGGRNQVFESGILTGKWRVYDVNSMYPYSMQAFLHPVGTDYSVESKIGPDTCFLTVEGVNEGAFPVRTKAGGLDFTVRHGQFHTTIHEYLAAVETGCFHPTKIVRCYDFALRESFSQFVTHFYDLRKLAVVADDSMHKLFYKYVLNSAYGKFAQNPDRYYDWEITRSGDRPDSWHDCDSTCDPNCRRAWSPSYIHDVYVIWQRPTTTLRYYNVCTGASITGAARALLLRGLRGAVRPIYCDTDSIICEVLSGVPLGSDDLGAWKLEATADCAAIAGKKLYALFSGSECVKKAHKGARLTGDEILRIARGETIHYDNPVPAFRWDGSYSFVSRNIRRTM